MQSRQVQVFLTTLLIVALVIQFPSGTSIPSDVVEEHAPIERVYGVDLSGDIYRAVSPTRYKNFIIKFTENGSRAVGTNNNLKARQWIEQQLVELSNDRIEVEVLGPSASVVGRLPGWLPYEAPVLMVGGHLDSVAGAPGANDDATGVATMLELAAVMSAYDWPLDIYFCAWNAEEVGLVGSTEVAEIFKDRGVEILAYYNVDMLLVEDPNAPADERVLMAYNDGPQATFHNGRFWAELTRMMSKNYGYNLIRPLSSGDFSVWTRSDHYPFLREGYQNVLFAFESGFMHDHDYHQPTDTWDNPNYNYTLAHDTVASIGASMAYAMARAYGQKTSLSFSTRIKPGEKHEYYFEVSMDTNLIVEGGWSGSGIEFTLNAPNGATIEQIDMLQTEETETIIFDVNTTMLGLYTISFDPLSDEPTLIDLLLEYESDMEGNGIPDSEEYWLDASLYTYDHDNDGLSDATEIILGTDTHNADSDGDGIPDGWEIENGFDPLVPDSTLDPDEDGLNNYYEYLNGTSPHSNDTDMDLMPDAWEVANGLDPNFNDAMADFDRDGLTNLEEFELGTDPMTHNGGLGIEILVVVTTGAIAVLVIVFLFRRSRL
jgi:hypothetical protein